MKKFIIGISATCVTAYSPAADLIVEGNGVLPNFGTIQDAVTAAAPNDRIFIKNKTGNIPYQENVTIDKPIELLPFEPDGDFLVFGNYTISANGTNFTVPDESVRIIGMNNLSGSINSTANNSTGNPIRIDVLGCQLVSGSITISGVGFISHIAGNWLASGSVTTRAATIAGNLINGNITANDPAGTVVDDTCYIVGNRLTTNTGGVISGRISWNNNDQYFHIANNHIRSNSSSGLIQFAQILAGPGENVIVNNSLETTSSATNIGVNGSLTVPAGARLKIENNAMHEGFDGDDTGNTERAVSITGISSGALIEINYNIHRGWEFGLANVLPTQAVMVGNVTASAAFDVDDVSGVCSSAEALNGGHPGTDYTDHDLTRNDVGVAGGSLSYTNYWPILTGGARVYLVKTPRTVVQSSTINAEADAHDR